MAEKTTRIVIRQGTAAQWASENPILAAGEPGYATDSKIVKFGDGSSRWLDLTGIQANPSSPREGAYIPALSFGADSTGVTYASRAGRYTLLGGDQVSFSLNLQLSAKGSATGDTFLLAPFPERGAVRSQASVCRAANSVPVLSGRASDRCSSVFFRSKRNRLSLFGSFHSCLSPNDIALNNIINHDDPK